LGERASPQDIATTLAEMKAVRVSSRHAAAMVIGADSTLACNGRLFDKPATLAAAAGSSWPSPADARTLFLVVVAQGGVRSGTGARRGRLTMRPFTEILPRRYLARAGEAVCASVGAYQLEGLGAHLFNKIEGDYFTVLACRCCRCSASLAGAWHRPGASGMNPYDSSWKKRGPAVCRYRRPWPVEHSRSPRCTASG